MLSWFDYRSLRFWIWTAAIFVTFLDKRGVLSEVNRLDVSTLARTGLEESISPNLKKMIESFPAEEREYFISAPPPVDGFTHQRVIEMAFPRVYSAAARCGFAMDETGFRPPQAIDLTTVKYHVVCHR